MKKKTVNILVGCCLFGLLAAPVTTVHAQDWKSVLGGVAKAVAEKKGLTPQINLTGTWRYAKPDCQFESENLLAKAGGEMAAQKVEDKMANTLTKIGFDEGCTYVFNADSTYTSTVKGRTTQGTYSYNAETKELTLTTRLGVKMHAAVSQGLSKDKLSLRFKADKLMNLMQTVGSTLSNKSSNTTIQTATAVLNQYDGLQVGFELQRQ